ncbi:hypothetical protein ACTFIW_002161 [Dictyostelium discoideum]
MFVDKNNINNNYNNNNNKTTNINNSNYISENKINDEEEILILKSSTKLFNSFNKNVPKEISNLINPNRYYEFIKKINKLIHPKYIFILIILIFITTILIFPMVFFLVFKNYSLFYIIPFGAIPVFITCFLIFSGYRNKNDDLIELETKNLNEELKINGIPIKFNIIYSKNPGNKFVTEIEITYIKTNSSESYKITLEA